MAKKRKSKNVLFPVQDAPDDLVTFERFEQLLKDRESNKNWQNERDAIEFLKLGSQLALIFILAALTIKVFNF